MTWTSMKICVKGLSGQRKAGEVQEKLEGELPNDNQNGLRGALKEE